MDLTTTAALLWLLMQTTASPATQSATTTTAPAPATTQPVAAVWYQSSRPVDPGGESRRLIVGVWADGRVVWSDDGATGGKPYRTARIARDRVDQLLTDLGAAKFFGEARKVNFGPDASYTVLAAERGADRQWLGSWHEPPRGSKGRSVVTERGIVPVPPGEKPPEPSPDYRRYLGVWAKSRQAIEGVVPEAGEPLEEELDVRVFNVGRPPRGEKK